MSEIDPRTDLPPAREHYILAAARRLGPLTDDFPAPLYETLHELTRRAQQAGLINADIVAEDLPRIIAMLHSVLPTMDTASDGWRRYVTFILNAMSTAKPITLPSEPDRLHAAARYLAQITKTGEASHRLGRVDAVNTFGVSAGTFASFHVLLRQLHREHTRQGPKKRRILDGH